MEVEAELAGADAILQEADLMKMLQLYNVLLPLYGVGSDVTAIKLPVLLQDYFRTRSRFIARQDSLLEALSSPLTIHTQQHTPTPAYSLYILTS